LGSLNISESKGLPSSRSLKKFQNQRSIGWFRSFSKNLQRTDGPLAGSLTFEKFEDHGYISKLSGYLKFRGSKSE